MKEKTFEELIADNFRNDSLCVQMKVKAAMVQARELTKQEIIQIAMEDFGIHYDSDFLNKIRSLPTDRIKTEK